MREKKKAEKGRKNSGATVGYEAQFRQMADALRGSMDAAEYKHVALGLIFLKYISDAFEEKHAALDADRAQGADPEDPDEYRAVNIEIMRAFVRLRQMLASDVQLAGKLAVLEKNTTRNSGWCSTPSGS